jgi:DNA-binding NarL/FixJ family response regulator
MAATIRELRDPAGWMLAALALVANLLLRAGPLKAVIVAIVVLAVKVGAGAIWPKPKAPTSPPPRRPGHRAPGSRLSPRELEVAALIKEGLTNRQIGYRLVPRVGERGVDSKVRDIMDKLTVHSRAEIAAWYERYVASAQPK